VDWSPATLTFEYLLRTAAELEIEMSEFSYGNWSPAPHVNRIELLQSAPVRDATRRAASQSHLQHKRS
jgi:hypothetical protein